MAWNAACTAASAAAVVAMMFETEGAFVSEDEDDPEDVSRGLVCFARRFCRAESEAKKAPSA